MAIVKKKDKLGRAYFFNENTGKRTTEAAYKRAKAAPIAKYAARKGKPSGGYCSTAGRELKVKRTSSAGRRLRSCR